MKRFSSFVHVINWLFATTAAIALLTWGCQEWAASTDPSGPLPPLRAAKLFGGAALLAANLLWLILRIQTSRVTTYIIFEKEGTGSLQVSVEAIEDLLTKCAHSIPKIVRARVVLLLDKGGKMPRSAVAHCIFTEVPNLFAVQDSARQTISSRYQEIFPGEQLQIEIVVDRLQPEGQPDPEPPRKKKRDKGKTEDNSFIGPRYPVGG